LNYRDLLAKVDQTGATTTIGFIPWNYRRTNQGVAQLFRERSDRLSLCVHGCDHTNAEFATTDVSKLHAKVRLASQRMSAHVASTGIPFARAMVFPQGQFSSESLRVLKCSNYMAGINSGAIPVDVKTNHNLRIADFLDVAITKFSAFPLFLRRYPGRLEDCALDLFFGKPLLIVEHHDYFRDGYKAFVEFISKLSSLSDRLEWRGLNDILTRTHLEKDVSDHTVLCTTYTNAQVIQNAAAFPRTYLIRKSEHGNVLIDRVLVNGHPAPYRVADALLKLAVRIPAYGSATIRIIYNDALPYVDGHDGLIVRGQVWTRRLLSEFRDNVLCKNHILFSGACLVKSRIAGQ